MGRKVIGCSSDLLAGQDLNWGERANDEVGMDIECKRWVAAKGTAPMVCFREYIMHVVNFRLKLQPHYKAYSDKYIQSSPHITF